MKVLLLGSSGFIGKALGLELERIHELVKVDRKTDIETLFKSDQTYDFIINCASSSPNANLQQSHESNFLYPKQFFAKVPTKNWVQVESYFQIQIPLGRVDPYSIEKQRFSEFLEREPVTHNSPQIHHLYMPHIFGEGDRPERLISAAVSSFRSGEDFQTSTGSQFLPLLHISDAVGGITRFMENPTKSASCSPFWYGTVRELLELISAQFPGVHVLYGRKPDPVDADFPRVEFPQSVEGWQPKMHLNEFLEWVKVRHG
jgi:nucleoside-diphosphate-sugar epimerase